MAPKCFVCLAELDETTTAMAAAAGEGPNAVYTPSCGHALHAACAQAKAMHGLLACDICGNGGLLASDAGEAIGFDKIINANAAMDEEVHQVKCRNVMCGATSIVTLAAKRHTVRAHVCEACGVETCCACGKQPHAPLSCGAEASFMERALNYSVSPNEDGHVTVSNTASFYRQHVGDDDDVSELLSSLTSTATTEMPQLKTNDYGPGVLACPACGVPIFKDGGCSHVVCSQCKTHMTFEGEATGGSDRTIPPAKKWRGLRNAGATTRPRIVVYSGTLNELPSRMDSNATTDAFALSVLARAKRLQVAINNVLKDRQVGAARSAVDERAVKEANRFAVASGFVARSVVAMHALAPGNEQGGGAFESDVAWSLLVLNLETAVRYLHEWHERIVPSVATGVFGAADGYSGAVGKAGAGVVSGLAELAELARARGVGGATAVALSGSLGGEMVVVPGVL